MKTCIIVPSHINNINRTKLLICCLQSLINQTNKIPIYLSISFSTDLDKTLFNKLIEPNLLNNILICVLYQKRQTSQFRHIEKVLDYIKNIYQYVMFCDDDDTYEINRVETFMYMIEYGRTCCPKDIIFVGVYESDLQKGNHSLSFYEYWSYCVNIQFIINFINIIKIHNYDYIIDNNMCDVLFSTYLRHLNEKHSFISTNEKLYNYNINEYSITQINKKNNKIKNSIVLKDEKNFVKFIQGLNESLEEYFEAIKNNIFVIYTMRKIPFENMLNELLKENYKYKNNINIKIIEKIRFEYDNIKYLCDILYQI
jgi:hypothetical protein